MYDVVLDRVNFCVRRIRTARPLLTEEQAKSLIVEYLEARIEIPEPRRRWFRSPSIGRISASFYRTITSCVGRSLEIITRQQYMSVFEEVELIKEVIEERVRIELIEQCYRISVLKEYYAKEKKRRTPDPVIEFRVKMYIYCRGLEEECKTRLLRENESMLMGILEAMEGVFSSVAEAQAQGKLDERWVIPPRESYEDRLYPSLTANPEVLNFLTIGVECEPIDEDEKEVGVQPNRAIRLAIFYQRYGDPIIYNENDIRSIERSIFEAFGVRDIRDVLRRLRESVERMRRR